MLTTIGNLLTASFIGELAALSAVAALAIVAVPVWFAVPFAAGVGLASGIVSFLRLRSVQRAH